MERTDDGRAAITVCPMCELCGAVEKLSLCAACRGTWYCSKDHQKKDWKSHKRHCRETERRKKSVTQSTAGGGVAAGRPPGDCAECSTSHDSPGSEEVRVRRITEAAAGLSVTGDVQQRAGGGGGTREDARRPVDEGHGRPSRGEDPPPSRALHTSQHTNNEDNVLCSPVKDMCENKSLLSDVNPLLDDDDEGGRVIFTCQPIDEEDEEDEGAVFEKPDEFSLHHELAKRGRPSQDSLTQKPLSQSSSSGSSFGSFSSSGYYSSDSNTDLKLHDYSRPPPPSHTDPPLSCAAQVRPMVNQPESTRLHKKRSAPKSSAMAPNIPVPPTGKEETKLSDYVTKCLTNYGICVVDRFCGESKGSALLDEVQYLEMSQKLTKGQISSATSQNVSPDIRGDRICWIEKGDPQCPNIGVLIGRLDTLMQSCNGRLGNHDINGRTKAMVACYPGDGTGYMRHVDNPNNDGRCVTCIYYLNRGWDINKDGGLLRIFPSQLPSTSVADIEPGFDRLLLFWSDRRNPHEVQPAFRKRFAITVWYFDAEERSRAKHRHKIQNLVSQARRS